MADFATYCSNSKSNWTVQLLSEFILQSVKIEIYFEIYKVQADLHILLVNQTTNMNNSTILTTNGSKSKT